MRWRPGGFIRLDPGEPYWRTCWVCNPSHGHLKHRRVLFQCLLCDRWWGYGIDFTTIENDHQCDEAMTAADVPRYEKEPDDD